MQTAIKKAYAKINLHLDITGIMPNGFHSVNTVMQSVSLFDTVTVTLTGDGKYNVTCNIEGVPLDERNLAVKAALAYEKAVGKVLGANIDIQKSIPMAAGLAGGSADAAATLLALNELYQSPLTVDELCVIGSALGADVPFCIVGGSAFADGKGDVLHPFPAMPDCSILIACGGEGVSTPAAYRMLDELYGGFATEKNYTPKDLTALRKSAENGDINAIAKNIYNIFEAPTLAIRPVAANIRAVMLENGALGAMMSGSGPSVFGIFADDTSAQKTRSAIEAIGFTAHLCRPI